MTSVDNKSEYLLPEDLCGKAFIAYKGQSASIEAVLKPNCYAKWYAGGVPVQKSPKFNIVEKGNISKLVVNNVEDSDFTFYLGIHYFTMKIRKNIATYQKFLIS